MATRADVVDRRLVEPQRVRLRVRRLELDVDWGAGRGRVRQGSGGDADRRAPARRCPGLIDRVPDLEVPRTHHSSPGTSGRPATTSSPLTLSVVGRGRRTPSHLSCGGLLPRLATITPSAEGLSQARAMRSLPRRRRHAEGWHRRAQPGAEDPARTGVAPGAQDSAVADGLDAGLRSPPRAATGCIEPSAAMTSTCPYVSSTSAQGPSAVAATSVGLPPVRAVVTAPSGATQRRPPSATSSRSPSRARSTGWTDIGDQRRDRAVGRNEQDPVTGAVGDRERTVGEHLDVGDVRAERHRRDRAVAAHPGEGAGAGRDVCRAVRREGHLAPARGQRGESSPASPAFRRRRPRGRARARS